MYKCGTKHCDEAHLFWIDCVNCLWDCSKWLQTLIKDSTLAVSGTLWSMRGQFLPSAEWKADTGLSCLWWSHHMKSGEGICCRAARGAGRKTSSEENPPWTCQRSIKTTNEWCRHTQAKTQVRHRIMSLLQAALPRTVHEPYDTCCKDRSFLENSKLQFDWLVWRSYW